VKDPTCQDSIGVLRHRCCRFNQHKDAIPSACSAKALFSVFPHRLSPDRALCLPTFSHLLIVNNLLSLSPLSLSLTLKRRLTYRPSVIYLIVNKLLSLSLSLSLSVFPHILPPNPPRRGVILCNPMPSRGTERPTDAQMPRRGQDPYGQSPRRDTSIPHRCKARFHVPLKGAASRLLEEGSTAGYLGTLR
jgi:hypothetical protein